MTTASAPGKVIISGEHSVVYQQPALAGALDLRCRVDVNHGDKGLRINAKDLDKTFEYSTDQLLSIKDHKSVFPGFDNLAGAVLSVVDDLDTVAFDLDIQSDVPIGAGLGSSAATSVAIVGALRSHLDLDTDPLLISNDAFEAEKIAHGTPSGIDNTTSSLGGLVHFQSGDSTKIDLETEIPLIIVNTNVPRNTKNLVSGVKERKDKVGKLMDDLIIQMGELTLQIEDALKKNDLELAGQLFDINQGLLDAIGVNHPKLTELIHIARISGAMGAKLTGAGGGGCFIVLTSENDKAKIRNALNREGVDIYETSISTKGVLIE